MGNILSMNCPHPAGSGRNSHVPATQHELSSPLVDNIDDKAMMLGFGGAMVGGLSQVSNSTE